jgi:hypothetical protein
MEIAVIGYTFASQGVAPNGLVERVFASCGMPILACLRVLEM